jgi:hypothetical protein
MTTGSLDNSLESFSRIKPPPIDTLTICRTDRFDILLLYGINDFTGICCAVAQVPTQWLPVNALICAPADKETSSINKEKILFIFLPYYFQDTKIQKKQIQSIGQKINYK